MKTGTAKGQDNTWYLQERLRAIGLSQEDNRIAARPFDAFHPVSGSIFTADAQGNIDIHYSDIQGNVVTYLDKQDKPKNFIRKRINPDNLDRSKDQSKYTQPPKSGSYPFFPPSIIEAFREKRQIPTLIITEGEFKAIAACIRGIITIAIPGIHQFAELGSNELHKDIQELINVCGVRRIILLFDADCLRIEYKPEKDLYTRPNSFYAATRRFKELTEPLNLDVFFAHILPTWEDKAKGFDDLLAHEDSNVDAIKQEIALLGTGTEKQYFHIINISANSIARLRDYFGIRNVHSFYAMYAHVLQEYEFIYRGSKYYHDGEKLILSQHADSELFMRIGPDFVKRIGIKPPFGPIEYHLNKWPVKEIIRDYSAKKAPGFMEQILKLDGFCNVPDNLETYQRIHTTITDKHVFRYYNLYEPLSWVPIAGSIKTIDSFLDHITGTPSSPSDKGNPKLIMLDYLTLKYRSPMQMLPVICLVSRAQGTGKTTFLKLLKKIFGSNAVILGNKEFNMDFNTHYIQKSIIMIDEGSIRKEKNDEKERLKHLATANKQFYHPKGIDPVEIEYYGSLIITSNEEENFMPMDDDDIRFFVLKIPKLIEEDPDILDRMTEEIPAFLFFLKHREITYPKKSRAWFSPEILQNEQLNKIRKNTRRKLDQDVNAYIQDIMEQFNKQELEFTAKDLLPRVNEISSYKNDLKSIRNFLKQTKGMKPQATKRYSIPPRNMEDTDPDAAGTWLNRLGRPYLFKREEWVDPDDVESASESGTIET